MSNIKDLIVSAEDVQTGERLIGYVCGCKSCRTAFEHENYDHNRSIGLLTHPEGEYGNVRVYTDTMELVKFSNLINRILFRRNERK